MMRRLTRFVLIAGLVLASAATGLAQRPYATIQGRVLDQNGKPLANAAVLLYGTSLLGSSVFITTPKGAFHFQGLLPGTYALRVELPEYKTKIWKDIPLGPGQSLEWNPVLESNPSQGLGVEEEALDTRPAPMIDMRSPAFKTEFDSLLLSTLPTNRDVYDFQNAVPGAVSEDDESLRTSSILGGTVRSQIYKVDGGFVNDPVDFGLLTNLHPDVLETIAFEQAGHPAESGQAGSASLNIITKALSYRTTRALQAFVGGSELNKVLFSQEEISKFGMSPHSNYSAFWDFSFSLGGPLLEDMLWMYINGRRLTWDKVNPYQPEKRMAALSRESSHYDLAYRDWTAFARIAFQYEKVVRYAGLFQLNGIYEPVYFASATPQASQEFTSILDHGTELLTTHYISYLLAPATSVDIRGTYLKRSVPLTIRDNDKAASYDYTQDVYFGSGFYNEARDSSRLTGNASITTCLDGLLGADHEIKAGFEFEQSDSTYNWYKSNQFRNYWYDYATGNPYYYSPELKQGRLSISPCPANSDSWAPSAGLRRFAGFVQDSMRVGRLAVNLGVYVDYSYLYRNSQARTKIVPLDSPEFLNPELTMTSFLTGLSDQATADGLIFPLSYLNIAARKLAGFITYSPRLGLVLDVFGDNRTALKGSLARYHEPFWIGLYDYDQVFSPTSVDWKWTDLNGNGLMDAVGVDSYVLTHYPDQDPNVTVYAEGLKAPYTDEVMLGLEQQLFPDFKIGLNLIYKIDKNIIASYDANNGYDPTATDSVGPIWLPFTFTDPGADAALGTADDRTLTVYGLRQDRPVPDYVIGNIPEAKREYRAAILSFVKRLSHNWELQGSLTFSSYKGNIGSGYKDTDFETAAFSSPNSLINSYGPLAFDRPVQFRLMGTALLPWDVVVSAYFQAYSGIPWNRTLSRVYFPSDFGATYGGVQTPYATVNAETIGSHRYEAYINLDLHLEKGFSLGGGGKFSVIADIFNVLGRRGQVYYNDQAGTLHYDTLPVTYQTAANFGTLASLYGVRALRLGVRIGF